MEPIEFFLQNKHIFTIIHVFSVIIGMGGALISDFLFNFYSSNKSLNKTESRTLRFLSNLVWISLVFIILSGFSLFFSDPYKYEHSQKFISKMFIMVILLANGIFLHKFIAPHFDDRGLLKFKNKKTIRQIAFACGAISLVSWLVVFTLGSINSIPFHFSEFLLYYFITIFIGSLAALIVEHKTFK